MRIRCVEKEDLEKAIKEINKIFENNIEIRELDEISKSRGGGYTYRLRLSAKDSSKAGARRSAFMVNKDGSMRKLPNACWHVNGKFFDALLKINPKAIIYVMGNQKIYKKEGKVIGNWKDRNIGSVFHPVMYSEACECRLD